MHGGGVIQTSLTRVVYFVWRNTDEFMTITRRLNDSTARGRHPEAMAGVPRKGLLDRARHCLAALAAMPRPATGYANTHGFRSE
jgi:hypothetical protein